MPRYLIRPRTFRTTPRVLHELLGTQRTVRYTGHNRYIPDWSQDFFLSYMFPSTEVHNADEEYSQLHQFYCASKSHQREILAESGILVPNSYPASRYIVRPLRHYGGRSYRVTEDINDFDPATSYVSHFFPKTSEYRIIFVKGKVIATLLKRTPEDIDPIGPWNHANGCSFVTVHNNENNRLRRTSVYEDLLRSPIIQKAHLIGADILYCKRQPRYPSRYAVCEINFCPALTIDNTLEKIKQHVHSSS